MKTERKILVALVLNLAFSLFEFFGGIVTGSAAILSDAVHDLGDAVSIGIAFFLEKKSKRRPDEIYTYGYGRYSVLGGLITTAVLLTGSAVMICHAAGKLLAPTPIRSGGMIVFALIGVCVNFCAAVVTGKGSTVNQKAVNLHMLEDVLGWAVVLVGAVVMHIAEVFWLDPVLSAAVSLFVFIHAMGNLKEIAVLFLEKVPPHVEVAEVKKRLEALDGVLDAHHIHIRSLDGQNHVATVHIVTDEAPQKIKAAVREALRACGIGHVTVETETAQEHCHARQCLCLPPTAPSHSHG